MNILLLGSGGREHAIAHKIMESPIIDKLFVAPGNAGTADIAENVQLSISDFKGIADFVNDNVVNILVVGPEAPLVDGLADFLKADKRLEDLIIIGPSGKGAMLEGSKDFAKEFMLRNNIPTAGYITIDKNNVEEGYDFIEKSKPPYVLKADGLAAGKGVLIIDEPKEAKDSLLSIINGKFGDAGNKVVIEEFLSGIEISVFVITDGKDYKILGSAKDYKRIGEGDTGLNTGGMGAVSPVPFADRDFMFKVEEKIIKPTINGLQNDKIDYCGFIFFGLMNVDGEPFVIEYNVRMGDPETEVVLPRMKTDIIELFQATHNGTLEEFYYENTEKIATTVVMVSGGYPEDYEKGMEITGIINSDNHIVFHSGTKLSDGKILSDGGRVLSITGFGENMQEALNNSYKALEKIHFDKSYYRKDIGQDLIKYL